MTAGNFTWMDNQWTEWFAFTSNLCDWNITLNPDGTSKYSTMIGQIVLTALQGGNFSGHYVWFGKFDTGVTNNK